MESTKPAFGKNDKLNSILYAVALVTSMAGLVSGILRVSDPAVFLAIGIFCLAIAGIDQHHI